MLTILQGDASTKLRELPEASVHACITSPPYWGLRDYGVAGQLGLEKRPEDYVAKMVAVFHEVKRVLRGDGVLWLNLGDTFAGSKPKRGNTKGHDMGFSNEQARDLAEGLKPKDLVGIPWMVAFALRSDGWYLRQWMPWVKKNSMPESVNDRPSSACEVIFLLSKNEHYHYDYDAVKLPGSMAFQQEIKDGYNGSATKDFAAGGAQDASAVKSRILKNRADKQRVHSRRHAGFNDRWDAMEKEEQCGGWRATRNSDWFFEGLLNDECGNPLAFTVNPVGYREAHFATFPPALIQPCILAGCHAGGTVLDPFAGSGTTGEVALRLGRKSILIELNPDYIPLIKARCAITPGLALTT